MRMAVAMMAMAHGRSGKNIGRRHAHAMGVWFVYRALTPDRCYLLSMCTLQVAFDAAWMGCLALVATTQLDWRYRVESNVWLTVVATVVIAVVAVVVVGSKD